MDSYFYDGTARFLLNPFEVSPSGCAISYSCTPILGPQGFDLCDYSSPSTTTSFNKMTGDYAFQSSEWETVGNQSLKFEIKGTSGSSSATVTMVL